MFIKVIIIFFVLSSLLSTLIVISACIGSVGADKVQPVQQPLVIGQMATTSVRAVKVYTLSSPNSKSVKRKLRVKVPSYELT